MNGKNLSDSEFVEKYNSIVDDTSGDIGCFLSLGFIGAFFLFSMIIIFFDLNQKLSNNQIALLYSFFGILLIGLIGLIILVHVNREKRRIHEALGMTKEKATRYYVAIIDNVVGIWCMPLVRQVCMLNPEAKESQIQMMKGWYGVGLSSIESVYEERCGNADKLRLAYKDLLKEPLSYRKFFVEKLFKLAIVDDGIHNDEWNLLMDIMKQLKFNKNYVDFFIKRYGPLRTEFEDDESGENTSTKSIPVSQLKAYFAILGLEEDASDVEIKKAYHNLALQHHPDLPKNADRVEECETMMAKINEAYEKIRK